MKLTKEQYELLDSGNPLIVTTKWGLGDVKTCVNTDTGDKIKARCTQRGGFFTGTHALIKVSE